MSMLNAINIQGIRSFDPKSQEVLHFLKPVTLILGQNGTGKTTIIESLKYASSGEMPPGSRTGGAFVHDPKIAGETEIKGKVSLEITNLKGEPLTVTRILKATQKNKQVSQTTIDSCIQKLNDNGQYVSISSKCSDIDLEMTLSLGVSKAVLENVIFCHQEDSNWPLIEGKAVKERFDDLFASVRYVKALESIRKIKQEKELNVKEFKCHLGHLKENLDESKRKLSAKMAKENEVECFNLKIVDAQEELRPIEESLENYYGQRSEISEYQRNKEILLKEKNSIEERIEDLKSHISETINDSSAEIERLMKESDSTQLVLKGKISEKEKEVKILIEGISKLDREKEKLLLDKGSLTSKIEINDNQETNFFISINQLFDEIGLQIDSKDPPELLYELENSFEHMKMESLEKMGKINDDLRACQNELDVLQSKKIKMEHDIEMNEKTLKDKKKMLLTYEQQLTSIGEDSKRLILVQERIDNLKLQLSNLQNSFDAQSVSEEIETLSNRIKTKEEIMNENDIKLTKYQDDHKKYNERHSLEQQKAEKLINLRRLRNSHNETLQILFHDVPEKNLKKLLSSKINVLHNKNVESQSIHTRSLSKLAAFDVELKQLKDKIYENENLVRTFEDNVFEICGNSNLENSLLEFKDQKKKLEEELLSIQSNASLYKKFKDLLLNNQSDCPLCHREFNHESEVHELIEEIDEKCNSVPFKVTKIQKELVDINNKIEKLIKLESNYEKISKLKNSVIDELQNKLEIKKNDISQLQNDCHQLEKSIEMGTENEKLACSIVGAVANMEKYNDEIEIIDKSLKSMEHQFTMSFEEFQIQHEEIKTAKKNYQNELCISKKELEDKRKYYDISVKNQNLLSSEINNLESECLKIKQGLNDWSGLLSQKDNVLIDINEINNKIQVSKELLIPIANEFKTQRSKYTLIEEKKNDMEKEAQSKTFNFRKQIDSFKTSWNNIFKFKQENYNERLKVIKEKILETEQQIHQYTYKQEALRSEIEDVKTEINNQKTKQRDFQDTLQIRILEGKQSQLQSDINQLDSKLVGFDTTNMLSRMKRLEDDRKKYKNEIESFESKKIQALTAIEMIRTDLSMEPFLNSNTKYLDMIYQLKTTELAISDLEKYYKALDKAIMSYHQSKMAEINKILKEYWQNTYSGKDIDYIEICSDEDNSASGAKKRSYNYRVVMVKGNNGARLDMRGRCSAGQKVLASLLIRLALAEVFCIHCGVLALDEPTTNLDHENIENLAYALVEIIRTRSKQKNFQLIVITHDEEFVKLLGRSDFVDQYYKIYSDSNGHSRIEAAGIDRMA